jgi:hypothetical protein
VSFARRMWGKDWMFCNGERSFVKQSPRNDLSIYYIYNRYMRVISCMYMDIWLCDIIWYNYILILLLLLVLLFLRLLCMYRYIILYIHYCISALFCHDSYISHHTTS